MTTSDDELGPFDGLSFDEDFVRRAPTREPTADDRARRARAEAEEDLRIAVLREARGSQRKAERTSRRKGRLKKAAVWAGIAAFVGWYAYAQFTAGDDAPTAPEWTSAKVRAKAVEAGPGTPRPTPAPPKSTVRMSSRPEAPPADGDFRFLSTQPGSEAPVAYDPCRVIRVVINSRTMPAGAEGLVEDALEEVGIWTGLAFEVEGPTDEPPGPDRPDFQPERYGDRWAPVLIAWTDPDQDPRLGGGAAGVGGSSFVETTQGRVYVTGGVVLDGPDLTKLLELGGADGDAYVSDVIRHELGHLVGLDHVDSNTELMFPEGRAVGSIGFGPGDRRGLYELGAGNCVAGI